MLLTELRKDKHFTALPVMLSVQAGVVLLAVLLCAGLPRQAHGQESPPVSADTNSLALSAEAGDNPDGTAPTPDRAPLESTKKRRGLIELKRENTARGTDDESTKTTIKFITYLSGIVSLFRLELPFPDAKTDFAGDPFNPREGDFKMRFGFRQFSINERPFDTFVEFTFPTANPASLGGGKYQVSPGIETVFQLGELGEQGKTHKFSLKTLLQHFLSVAGDESRKDINYSKLEFTLKDRWRIYWLSLLFKPAIDWVQKGKTGAVGELEAGWNINPDWSIALKGGRLLWGTGVPSTYSTRGTLTLVYQY